jgi:hypothetical protein
VQLEAVLEEVVVEVAALVGPVGVAALSQGGDPAIGPHHSLELARGRLARQAGELGLVLRRLGRGDQAGLVEADHSARQGRVGLGQLLEPGRQLGVVPRRLGRHPGEPGEPLGEAAGLPGAAPQTPAVGLRGELDHAGLARGELRPE